MTRRLSHRSAARPCSEQDSNPLPRAIQENAHLFKFEHLGSILLKHAQAVSSYCLFTWRQMISDEALAGLAHTSHRGLKYILLCGLRSFSSSHTVMGLHSRVGFNFIFCASDI
jgi:hypothetical protein